MYSKIQLIKDMSSLGIKPNDTLLVHSSMKAIGEVENGADTVLDAFIEYMRPGLLLFPTHTWALMGKNHPIFNPLTDPSCVGILTNLFRKRPGVLRSLHPTHSLAALGTNAAIFVQGEERCSTPCPRFGCYGKLCDYGAKVLFLGCSLNSNTFLHGVEEWNHIPNRLTDKPVPFKIAAPPDGRLLESPMYRHESPVGDISRHYGKMEVPFLRARIASKGKIGDAASILCDAAQMADLTTALLARNPDLFLDDIPVPEKCYV